jgi:hypothetical protein
MLREFDERAGFLAWSFDCSADWLAWRCDVSLNAAREKMRSARALKDLLRISQAFAEGRLSYSKVRALTRVATRENEERLLAYATKTTAARLEEYCRQLRNVQPDNAVEAERVNRERKLRVFRDGERGTMTITVELPIEQGELVCRALEKAVHEEVERARVRRGLLARAAGGRAGRAGAHLYCRGIARTRERRRGVSDPRARRPERAERR